jgi:hypothetical protein
MCKNVTKQYFIVKLIHICSYLHTLGEAQLMRPLVVITQKLMGCDK